MTSPDYGKIINRSWSLTWKNKWLWVYGLVIAAISGSSFNYSGSGGSSGDKTSPVNDLQNGLPSNVTEEGKKVLGQATNVFSSWLAQVSATTWVLLALGIVLLIVFGIIVNMVVTVWAKGSLISGLSMADNNEEVGLTNTSKKGLLTVKNLIIYGFISLGIVLGVVLLALVLFGLLAIVGSFGSSVSMSVMVFVAAILGVLVFLTLVVFLVILSMVGVYAERLIVLKDMAPWEAWKKGLSLSKGNFLHTALMGIINGIIGCTVSCLGVLALLLVLGIPAVILVVPMFAGGSFHFSWALSAGLVTLFFLGIWANLVMRAVMVVFNTSNWNLFFKEVTQNEKSS